MTLPVSSEQMSLAPLPLAPPEAIPDEEKLITEDGAPVDSIYSERLMRLLTGSLYASWRLPEGVASFLALANVGLFYVAERPPLVPDVLVSLNVELPDSVLPKKHRSYFIWRYGKPPEWVAEIVSGTEGDELGKKKTIYAEMGVTYYVVWDPELHIQSKPLQCFVLEHGTYKPTEPWFPKLELGVVPWEGEFEGTRQTWLRWCDKHGNILPTGLEVGEQERQRAEQERLRAEQEKQRAEVERVRAERLIAQLRALGVKPEE
ncbi:MAG: Uma2 family endonuclease [Gemmataceae bacterium]|nr:Uma2 family endonuclease [Gemmataceae bacterium]MCI0741136.1 Uma2 family endonuclease [Gemmataceae bacterium]